MIKAVYFFRVSFNQLKNSSVIYDNYRSLRKINTIIDLTLTGIAGHQKIIYFIQHVST